MKRILFIPLFALWASTAVGQSSVQIDTTHIMIGDQLTLTSYGPQFPTMESLAQGDIQPVRQWFDTVADAQGKNTVCQKTLLTIFEEGEHWLKLGDHDSVLITVDDVPNVDTASLEIRDIAPVMKEPYTFWELFRWVLVALGVVAVVWAIVYVAKKISKKEPIIVLPKAPPTPPDQQALADLESLRQRQLWQQGKVKEYHTDLTDILRQYLFKTFGINSIEMTTDQTLAAFDNCHSCNADSRTLLRSILQTADMVKFAKSTPQPYEHDRSMDNARQFVTTTWAAAHPAEPQKATKEAAQ